jgi:hypothetical protein
MGYAAAEGWPGWWGLEGPEYLTWLGEQPEANYTILMGATTYRVMSGLAAEGELGTDALAGMSKVVFSTTFETHSFSHHTAHPRDGNPRRTSKTTTLRRRFNLNKTRYMRSPPPY